MTPIPTPPRALIVVPHFYQPKQEGGPHASLDSRRRGDRLRALEACLFHLRSLFAAEGRWAACHDTQSVIAAPPPPAHLLDLTLVVVTTGGHHLLDEVAIPPEWIDHRPVVCDPPFLGFAAQEILAEGRGAYDWYGYLEDDLALYDPLFFAKLSLANRAFDQTGPTPKPRLLLPHRWEDSLGLSRDHKRRFRRILPDWRLAAGTIFPGPALRLDLGPLLPDVTLAPALGPHAGCFFLSAAQMETLAAHPTFLDRDTVWTTPLDSAATRAIANAFALYKPGLEHAGFLEIRHACPLMADQVHDAGPDHPPRWEY